jgi:hypothetical protein
MTEANVRLSLSQGMLPSGVGSVTDHLMGYVEDDQPPRSAVYLDVCAATSQVRKLDLLSSFQP